MTRRDPYKVVGQAYRETVWRAAHLPRPLRERQRRVLDAALVYLASYSLLEDRVSTRQIAEMSGYDLKGGDADHDTLKMIGKELRGLRDLGLIRFESGSGRHRGDRKNVSRLGLIVPASGVAADPCSEVATGVDPAVERGSIGVGIGGRSAPVSGVSVDPPPEKVREVSENPSENRGDREQIDAPSEGRDDPASLLRFAAESPLVNRVDELIAIEGSPMHARLVLAVRKAQGRWTDREIGNALAWNMKSADSWPAVAAHRLRSIDVWVKKSRSGPGRPGDYGGVSGMAAF
jgi:hypothetical protein